MTLAKSVAAFCCATFVAASAQASTLQDEYPFDLQFNSPDASMIFGAGQTWNLRSELEGWTVTVKGSFNQDYDFNTVIDGRSLQLSNTNLSGSAYTNREFPDANGIYIRNLKNEYNSSNLIVNFSFTFENVSSSLSSLGLGVFSGESMDAEEDTLTHSNGTFRLYSDNNLNPTPPEDGSSLLPGVRGDGTSEMKFREGTGLVTQNGDYSVETGVVSGDTITWSYDYLGPTVGANMIGISASGFEAPAAIPTPAGGILMLTALSGLAVAARRRARREG